MLSSIMRSDLEKELKSLKEDQLIDAKMRLEAARREGDLSENEPFNIARSDISRIQLRIVEIEEILKNAGPVQAYSYTISPGTFFSYTYTYSDGSVEDFGLHMMDLIGNPIRRTICPKSELGRQIVGTTGGTFTVKDTTGRLATVEVKVHGEDKLSEYLSLLPNEEDPYGLMSGDNG